jgi:hypothetical protein
MEELNLENIDGLTIIPILKGERYEPSMILNDKNIKAIYQGRYCIAVKRFERNLGARSKYSVALYFKPVGSPDAINDRAKIAFWFSAKFPDLSIISTSEITEDQIWLLLSYKDWITRFSLIFSGLRDNPFTEDLEDGILHPLEHELLWNKAKLYSNLWELISLRWKPIELCLSQESDWSFESPVHFFQEIIESDFREEINYFWRTRHEFNILSHKNLAKLQIKQINGEMFTDKEIGNYQKYNNMILPGRNIWRERLERIIQNTEIRRIDPTVDAYLKIIAALKEAICKLNLKACCDPTSGFHSVTWIDGRKYPGIQYKSVKGEIAPARRNKS